MLTAIWLPEVSNNQVSGNSHTHCTWNKERWRIQHSSDLPIGHEGAAESDATDEGAKVESDLLDGRVLEKEKQQKLGYFASR
jgi:hypothetical protein